MKQDKAVILETARQVLADELRELENLRASLNERFEAACLLASECKGRVIFTGVGHSGHVGRKSAANMSSMRRPAFFLHADEALHGELGLVTAEDVVIIISNSGETAEVLAILPAIQRLGAKTIAITGNTASTLGKTCDIALPIAAREEAGPFKFAGSASALNSMALCDALVMAVAAYTGLTEADYLEAHPGGAVGKMLKEKLG